MALNNINTFAGAFLHGGIRPHLFEVTGNIGGVEAGQGSIAPFLIKAAQLPASTIGVIEVPWRGRKIKVPGDRTFAEWTITVLADGHMRLRDQFEKWSSNINTHEGNIMNAFPEPTPMSNFGNIYQDWQIYQLNRAGLRIKGYDFKGVFPSEVSAIDVNHETTDSLSEFTVTLQYTYWTSNTTDGNNSALANVQNLSAILFELFGG